MVPESRDKKTGTGSGGGKSEKTGIFGDFGLPELNLIGKKLKTGFGNQKRLELIRMNNDFETFFLFISPYLPVF